MRKKILLISYENEGNNIYQLSKELKKNNFEVLILDGAISTAVEFNQMPRNVYKGLDIPIKRFNEKIEKRIFNNNAITQLKEIEKKLKGRNIRQIMRTSSVIYDDHHNRKPFYKIPSNDIYRQNYTLEIINWYISEIEEFKPDICFCILGNCLLKVLAGSLSESYSYKFCSLSHSRIKNYIIPLNWDFKPLKRKIKSNNNNQKIAKQIYSDLTNIIYKNFNKKDFFKLNIIEISVISLFKNLKTFLGFFLIFLKTCLIIKSYKIKNLSNGVILPKPIYFYSSPWFVMKFFINRYTRKTLLEINSKRIFKSEDQIKKNRKNGFKYILYTMHVLPESSVLTFSKKYYEEDLIRYISGILPIEKKLLVKESLEMMGDRDLAFYDRVNKLGNIDFINPYISPKNTFNQIEGVIGISGTSILEAIFNKLPCACIGEPEFKELVPKRYQDYKGLENLFEDMVNNNPVIIPKKKIIDYIENLVDWNIKFSYNEWKSASNDSTREIVRMNKSNLLKSLEDFIINFSKD